jgi:hypothetical protein
VVCKKGETYLPHIDQEMDKVTHTSLFWFIIDDVGRIRDSIAVTVRNFVSKY